MNTTAGVLDSFRRYRRQSEHEKGAGFGWR